MTTHSETTSYDELRTAILSFELVPGERLSERGLEQVVGASRTPIRAALMRLENDGLVRRLARGWEVSPIDLAEVRAVMEYRDAIETAAVVLAVERASDDEIDAVRELAQARHDDEDAGLRAGNDFHLALTRLSRNPFMVSAMADALTRLFRTRWLEVRTAESRAQARAEHLEIVDAVAQRDAERAGALVAAHNRGTRERLMAHLGDERRRLRGRGFSIIESSVVPPPLSAA